MIENITVFQTRSSTWLPIKRYLPIIICCGALGLSASCATGNTSHLVSAPPPPTPTKSMTTTTVTTTPVVAPAVVVPNPASSATSTTTVITQIPPALQQEVPIAQPSSSHVWLAGFWTWRNDRYEWMSGHWEIPPSTGALWVSPRWNKSGNSYRFYEGYWK